MNTNQGILGIISKVESIIGLLFKIVLFFVPIVLYPNTSELFEFNKIVFIYLLTGLIITFWLVKMILEKKFIFRRTILDIPILIFLASQALATITSIDPRTSVFGYYSRFNGGLLSLICYALLYWAWVSSITKRQSLAILKLTFVSALLVCLYGILEHFGVDKSLWVQDVATRVFSTLGQPNWLAAWVTALMPLSWAFFLKEKLSLKNRAFLYWLLVSLVLFLTLIYTKSRSGFLGLGVAGVTFFSFYLAEKRRITKSVILITVGFFVLILLAGTPWTPSVWQFFAKNRVVKVQPVNIPASEMGGTESADIRKIVWKGALAVWRHNPVFGTGVETFAYAYYKERPIEHNLVSEWDFLYNKAHNEYLSFMANTGTVGILAYLSLILFSLLQISKSEFLNPKQILNSKHKNSENSLGQSEIRLIRISLLAGYMSILVTNFFGFSVTPINTLFYLFPGIAFTLGQEDVRVEKYRPRKLAILQKFVILILYSLALLLLYSIIKYWYADIAYNEAKYYYNHGKFVDARGAIGRAIAYSPTEAIYWDQLSKATAGIALALNEAQNTKAQSVADLAVQELQKAVSLSPRNTILRRDQTTLYLKLAVFDKNFLNEAKKSVLQTIDLAPTDAKLYYSLGLIYMRLGDNPRSLATLEKTIQMKPNYKEAHLAHALLLADLGRKKEAVDELNYILKKIDPKDELTQKELNDLTK